MMTKLILLVLFLIQWSSGKTQFNFGPLTTALDFKNHYFLGTLIDNIAYSLQIKFATTTDPTLQPNTFTPIIYDSAGVALGTQPSFSTTKNIPTDKSPIRFSWTNSVRGDYFLVLEANADPQELIEFTVRLTLLYQLLFAFADFFRSPSNFHVYKKGYGAGSTAYTLTTSPRAGLKIYQVDADNRIRVVSGTFSDSSNLLVSVDGFYIFSIEYSDPPTSNSGSIEMETYTCPFPDFYIDQSDVYQACLQLPTITKTDTFLAPFLELSSMFDLGTVTENSIIRIKIVFPGVTTNFKSFYLDIQDIDQNPINSFGDITLTSNSYETFWTVPVGVNGRYFLVIYLVGADMTNQPLPTTKLHWFYLTVWQANSNSAIIKQVDYLRENNICHLASTSVDSFIKVSMDKPGQKTLRSISNDWVVGDKVPIAHSSGVTQIWFEVTQGNYLACIDPAFGENAIYTYQSDGKAQCPYHSSYTDPRGIFSPCVANTNENSYPAIPVMDPPAFGGSITESDTSAYRAHSLGTFSGGQTVDITVSFPRPGISKPDVFTMRLVNADLSDVNPQPDPFGIPRTITNPFIPNTFSYSWTASSGSYKVVMERTSIQTPDGLLIYDLTVSQGGSVLAKETDVLKGDELFHLIYLSSSKEIELFHSANSMLISLYPMDSSNELVFSSTTPITENSATAQSKKYSLSAGFYAAKFTYDASAASTMYQSDPYLCPNTQGFNDVRKVFEPCAGGYKPPPSPPTPSTEETPDLLNSLPLFPLGSLVKGNIVHIRLDFPDLVQGINPQAFQIQILDNNRMSLPIQPMPMDQAATIDVANTNFVTFWTVPEDGGYFLEVTATDPAAGEALQWYYLTAWEANSNTALIKDIDVLRSGSRLYRYLYFQNPSTIILGHSGGAIQVNLFNTLSGQQYQLETEQTGSPSGNDAYYLVGTGFYIAGYLASLGSPITISSRTDAYTCPYDQSYSDSKNLFRGCTPAANSNAPVITFNTGLPFIGDTLLQLPNHIDAKAIHDLGSLTAGEMLDFKIQFQRPADKDPADFKFTILDGSNTPLNPQPFPDPVAITSGTFEHSVSWTVGADGPYRLLVDQGTPVSPTALIPYSLLVESSGTAIVDNEGDVARGSKRWHLLHFKDATDITLGNTFGSVNIELFMMDPAKPLEFPAPLQAETPASTTSITASFSNLKGFYALGFGFPPSSASSAFFQADTQPYTCPYTLQFTDIRNVFLNCNPQASTGGPVNRHQLQSLKAHQCTGRTYYSGGACHTVDSSCNTFDPRSGKCTTCATTGHEVQASGLCGRPTTILNCGTGATQVGSVCVSDKCATFNPDGSCSTCKSQAESVQSGSCQPKNCPTGETLDTATGNCIKVNNCPKGEFQVDGFCYRLPDKCASLNRFIQCDGCENNFQMQSGNCVPCKGPNPNFPCSTCPDRFFVGNSGGCTKVDPECLTYDPANGKCFVCQSGENAVNGVCCPSGQAVVGSTCVILGGAVNLNGASSIPPGQVSFLESAFFKHCKLADPITQVCKDCRPGHGFLPGTNLCV